MAGSRRTLLKVGRKRGVLGGQEALQEGTCFQETFNGLLEEKNGLSNVFNNVTDDLNDEIKN